MAIRDLVPWRRPAHGLVRHREEHPILSMHREMDRLFDDFFRGIAPWRTGNLESPLSSFVPDTDVRETDKEVRVSAELPGMDEKDIEVELTDGGLTIRGEKKDEREGKENGYHALERSYGSFCRTVSLPADVEADKATAEFKKGVLTVIVPKTPQAESRRKKVQINVK